MKKFAVLFSGVVAVVLGSGAPAFAGADLVTPTLYAGNLTNVACKLLNISTGTVNVNLRMMDAVTNTLLDESTPVDVLPGQLASVYVNAPASQVYCRFVGAKKTKVRATINSFEAAGDVSDDLVLAAY